MRGVLVNEQFRTSATAIYAAGNVIGPPLWRPYRWIRAATPSMCTLP
jgi:pyruvate/2-oxoglutarate dehydrogenase complex dihydrolipoamide dehydrogenase (E3) component